MREPGEPTRPATLVAALWLAALTGAANLFVGVVVLALLVVGTLPGDQRLSTLTLTTLGCAYVALGALTVLATLRLVTHRPGSRTFLSVLMLLRIVVACISFGVVGTWYSTGSVIGIAVSVLVIALLWDSRANVYFHAAG